MPAQSEHPIDPEQTGSLLPIVVGAHLRAEVDDRPVAYALLDRITTWQGDRARAIDTETDLRPIVCTDLWYLNTPDLREQPTISIGDPAWNAATAFCATRLPTALLIDDVFRVHLDPEFVTLQACIWGVDGGGTRSAVEAFVERYLDDFLVAGTR